MPVADSSLGNTKVIAALCYAFSLVSALIILLKESSSQYVVFHAWQSLFWNLFWFVVFIALWIVDFTLGATFVLSYLWFAIGVVLWITLMVFAVVFAGDSSCPFFHGFGHLAASRAGVDTGLWKVPIFGEFQV